MAQRLSAKIILLIVVFVMTVFTQNTTQNTRNPLIWADVPDPDIIRVDDTYYMSSTTMHMSPGLPIMKSKDLVTWEIVRYAYEVLADNDALTMTGGNNAYGKGSWASCIRYNNGLFYVYTFSYTTQKTHVYTTDNIENGAWKSYSIKPEYHDLSVLFDDDGKVYCISGNNNIGLVELTSEGTAIKQGGINTQIISNASSIAGSGQFYVQAEGSHIYKINGSYYIFLITWPAGSVRSQLVYRSDAVTGPYEGKVVLQDNGIAQGGIVETPDGDWYALLFKDNGSVGRVPCLVSVSWEDDWPVFGANGKVPETLAIPAGSRDIAGIVSSDEFDSYSDGTTTLDLAWQWNHNPVNDCWSVTDRKGYLRLTTDRVDKDFVETRNTLTQRTFGPECSAHCAVEVSKMKDGDIAGLGALQEGYGFVGVKKSNSSKYVTMVNAGREVASQPIDQNTVYFRIDMDFKNQTDKATFFYSLDGEVWESIGTTLQMSYSLSHFMGYRFALFNYATKTAGGQVDFDYYRTGYSFTDTIPTVLRHSTSDNIYLAKLSICNYPNPFKSTTRIYYAIAMRAQVEVDVFDVKGNVVNVLVNEVLNPGKHSIDYHADQLPSGTYFLRTVLDNSFQIVNKLIVLK